MARARSRGSRGGSIAAAVMLALASVAAPPVRLAAQVGDTALRRAALMPRAVPSGQFTYQTTLESGIATTIIGTRMVTVSQATYAGSPEWLLTEARTGNGIPSQDSLYLDPLTLSPVHWSSTLGQARVAAEFRSDTAFGGLTSPMGRRSMIVGMPHGTLVNGAMLETMLRLAPLQLGWEDSTAVLSLSPGSSAVLPARMSVIGEDRVRVPAGTFDCWVVGVHADPARGLYWVTKQNPVVVRSALDVPILGGAQLVNSLVRATP